jgi:hypothetical protein
VSRGSGTMPEHAVQCKWMPVPEDSRCTAWTHDELDRKKPSLCRPASTDSCIMQPLMSFSHLFLVGSTCIRGLFGTLSANKGNSLYIITLAYVYQTASPEACIRHVGLHIICSANKIG